MELNMPDWGTENRTHSQLWRIHHTIADIAPTATHLEIINHHAYPPWHQPLDPRRIATHISCQKKETEAETHTSLVNSLCNDPKHLLIYTDGSKTKNGSNGTGLVAIHANHRHFEARWNLGKHVEVYDSELFGILQATTYARKWTRDPNKKNTNTIWIFVENQAAIRKCTTPRPTAGQHLHPDHQQPQPHPPKSRRHPGQH